MNRVKFGLNVASSEFEVEQSEKALSDLRKARKLRPRPTPELLKRVEWIRRFGTRKFFSYSELSEALAHAGGPRVERLKLRRFIAKYLPEVFKFRSQFQFNRNVEIAKENQNEE